MHIMRNAFPKPQDRSAVAVTTPSGAKILVLGVGNEIRGDDAAGLIVSRQLKEKLARDIIITEQTGEGTRLVELWKEFDTVFVIDATKSGLAPGTIQRFEADKSPLPADLFSLGHSTHAYGVPQAVELARSMGQLPRKLLVYGIEGKCFDEGAGISPDVAFASQQLAELLVNEISQR